MKCNNWWISECFEGMYVGDEPYKSRQDALRTVIEWYGPMKPSIEDTKQDEYHEKQISKTYTITDKFENEDGHSIFVVGPEREDNDNNG